MKRLILATFAFGLAIGASSGQATSGPITDDDTSAPPTTAGDSREARRIERGLAIAPVRLDLAGKDRALVGLGSYLVNAAGGCNDCHTNPPFASGGDPFLGQPKKINKKGYLAGGMVFGPIVSSNITPDATGRPAGLTFAEFLAVFRSGTDPDVPGRLLQVMPWPVYQSMTFRDIRAIYEYLRAIPPVPAQP